VYILYEFYIPELYIQERNKVHHQRTLYLFVAKYEMKRNKKKLYIR